MGDALCRDAVGGVACVRLDDRRKLHPGIVGAVARGDETGVRHRYFHLFCDPPHERFVVAERERLRAGPGVRDTVDLKERRHVKFLSRVVVEPLVAEVEDVVHLPLQPREILDQRIVFAEVGEPVAGEFPQRRLHLVDGVEVVVVEGAGGFQGVGFGRIAEDHRDVFCPFLALRLRCRPLLPDVRGDDVAALHHPEVLVALRLGRDIMGVDPGETRSFQEPPERVGGVEVLGVELVGHDAFLDVRDHLTGYQALFVERERPLAADEHGIVDPLPRPRLEVLAQVLAVGDVQEHPPPGFEDTPDLGEDPHVFLDGVEVAETVPEDEDDVVGVGAVGEPPGVSLPEPDRERLSLRGRPGPLDQVVGLVEAFDVVAPAREFEGVPALAAAEVENPLVGLEVQDPNDPVDLPLGDAGVVDDVAIGLQVEAIEDAPPPVGLYVLLKVRDRPHRLPVPAFTFAPAIGRFVGVDVVRHAGPLSLTPFPE